jgi:hemoglobin-like flavoprotein
MTPEQITLVQSSFDRLGPRLPVMATRFYEELFRLDPGLRALFSTDLTKQEARFAEKIGEIVRAMPRLDDLLGHTRALGARHVGYRVRVGDYETVGQALLSALGAVLGDDFGPATREAWTIAYSLVSETMLDGAADARLTAARQAGRRIAE